MNLFSVHFRFKIIISLFFLFILIIGVFLHKYLKQDSNIISVYENKSFIGAGEIIINKQKIKLFPGKISKKIHEPSEDIFNIKFQGVLIKKILNIFQNKNISNLFPA